MRVRTRRHRSWRAVLAGVSTLATLSALAPYGAAASLTLLLAAPARAGEAPRVWPRVSDVRIEGARALDADEILEEWRGLVGGPAEPARLAAAADRTLARYARSGRLDAACRLSLEPHDAPGGEAPGGAGATLRVVLDEGPLVPLGAVPVEGASAIPERDVRRLLSLEPGAPFDPARFAEGAADLLARYESAGRPFARIAPRDFAADGSLSFRLVIDEGRPARLLGASVTGNASTKESFIAREMLLSPGRAWNRRSLERGRARLLRTGLFRSVGEPFPLVDEAGGGVRVGLAVEEALANRIEGVFGWNRGDAAEGGFFSGYLDVLFGNLGGVGRRAAARWERRAREAREIRLAYREPWLPLLPVGGALEVRRTFRDSTYVRTEAAGSLEMPLSAALTITGSAASDSWRAGDRTPATVPSSRRVRAGAGARVEATDYPPNPSRGGNVSLAVEYGSKRVEPLALSEGSGGEGAGAGAGVRTERFRETIGHAVADLFLPLGGPHLVALRARGDIVASEEEPVPEFELFFLGGARSLRGYDEDRFLGERVGVATVEYRFRLAGRSRLFLFVDQGYFRLRRRGAAADGEGSGPIETREGTPLGWGGGIQAASRLGIVGIGIGVPEGDGLSQARVHVSLEQEF